ncbi:MAG: winged helix-turn-helix transcriptional regulator [Treponema sp.]|nr:winged helix-turn-helix transcriptional regulator [Treponema sp.]
MVDKEKITLARKQFQDCSEIFVALGDITRQKICLDLAESADEGINVAQLTGKSLLSRPAISHHLKVLKNCGLVEPIKKGTQIFYRIRLRDNFAVVRQLIQTLDEIFAEENA